MAIIMKKEWHSLNTNNQNKPKMAQFLKFEFLIALELNFNGSQIYKKYKNLVISKSGKSHYKIIKFEVEHFERLRCKV